MEWAPITVEMDAFGCNHDQQQPLTYVHAMPSNQTQLFDFVRHMERSIETVGGVVHHARKSLFPMTLARVPPSYPTDQLKHVLHGHTVGNGTVSSFFVAVPELLRIQFFRAPLL